MSISKLPRAVQCLAVLFALAGPATAQDGKPPAKVTYDEHVRAIFREHCFSCHSAGRAKSDLELDSYAAAMRGGAGGEVVFAGDLDSSRLWGLVTHNEEPKMPPEQDKLPEAKLALIKTWILGGALENAGSTAKPSNKPKLDLSAAAGAKRPTGPPPMPENLSKRPFVHAARSGAATALAASPWAPLIAVGSQKQVLLYHSESNELLGVLPFPEGVPHVLKFSRSGTLLLAGGGRGAQRGLAVVYDVKTGQRMFEVGDELDAVLAADINADHTLIALGGPGRIVRIFSTADGSQLHEIRKHTDWIYALEFSPDGLLLATADRSNGILVWEADTAREYQNLKGHTAAITDVSWRTDSNVLASSSEDGTVRLWDLKSGNQIKSINAHSGGAASVEFAQDGKFVSTGRDKITKLWDTGGTQIKAFEALEDLGLEVAITHDSGRVIAGDWTGAIRNWLVADPKQVTVLSTNPPTLEMLAKAEAEKAAAAQATAEKLAAELAELTKQADQKLKAAQLADQKAADVKAEVAKLASEEAALKKRLAEIAVAVKSANDKLAATSASAAKAAEEKKAFDKVRAEKEAAAKAALEAAKAARAAAESAAEQAKAETASAQANAAK